MQHPLRIQHDTRTECAAVGNVDAEVRLQASRAPRKFWPCLGVFPILQGKQKLLNLLHLLGVAQDLLRCLKALLLVNCTFIRAQAAPAAVRGIILSGLPVCFGHLSIKHGLAFCACLPLRRYVGVRASADISDGLQSKPGRHSEWLGKWVEWHG